MKKPGIRKATKTWPSGGGQMGQLIRETDWSQTPLGPMESWSPALKTMVTFVLMNRFPHLLWWGPRLCQIYNDPYRPVLGTKHPKAMGQPAQECWPEIWHILQPLIETPFHGGPATWMEDIFLEPKRHGFVEETHFTIAYSPVADDTVESGIGGVIATVHEITEKVIGERRVIVLRDLGVREEAKTAQEVCAWAAQTLSKHPKDIPFALIYLLDAEGKDATLAGSSGIEKSGVINPERVVIGEAADALAWNLGGCLKSEKQTLVANLQERFGSDVPPGPWSDAPQKAVVAPIHSNVLHRLAGFLVAGVSSRLKFDESYSTFIELVATQIATAIANARAYEVEKRRAESLAELDRAKTAFFSNVSHEFRTPLTLMVGPIEDALADKQTSPLTLKRLDMAHRNSLRLLKLVNTLLDFSRLEAGRIQAVYEAVDLSSLTADLASVFRSAVERAGMKLTIDCPPLHKKVYVDREMWEKIIMNLLSNAFKFTFEGEIHVSVNAAVDCAVLSVRDTGTGIPEKELPHIFKRFHRVQGAHGRSYEGSGIGLALVQELVKLHGGSVRVESESQKGSTFTVSVPFGVSHLPPDRIGGLRSLASTATSAISFVEEAMRWLPDQQNIQPSMDLPKSKTVGEPVARILVADDNADMRDYLVRLLSEQYEVTAVADGLAALKAAQKRRPDLILSDVMMPKLDGMELLKTLRSDEFTASIPIILLSARAGEEARVEGMDAGADDYLIKPFSARELLARVRAHLEIARVRQKSQTVLRESEERFRELADNIDQLVWTCNELGFATWYNQRWYEYTGTTFEQMKDRGWEGVHHPDHLERVREGLLRCLEKGEIWEDTFPILSKEGEYRWFLSRAVPIRDENGKIVRWFGTNTDITDRKRTEEALQDSEARLRLAITAGNLGTWDEDVKTGKAFWSENYFRMLGYEPDPAGEAVDNMWSDLVHPEDRERVFQAVEIARNRGTIYASEHRMIRADNKHVVWASESGCFLYDQKGNATRFVGVCIDSTSQKQQEKRLTLLAQFGEITRTATDVNQLLFEIARAVGEHLHVSRCLFNEIDTDHDREIVHSDYCKDVPSVTGVHKLSEYSAATSAEIAKGKTIVNHDSKYDSRTAAEFAKTYGPNQERAYIAVPLFRNKKWVASLWVSHHEPRQWLAEEVSLLEEIAERTWAMVEKMRSEADERTARIAAEEASRLKDEFLATVSHELRTPLNSILGWAYMLRSAATDPGSFSAAVDAIYTSAKNQAQIIDDLLDVARIISGKMTLQPRIITLSEMINAAFNTVSYAIAAKHIQLDVQGYEKEIFLYADPHRLQQILWNLLSNAVKFTPVGGRINVHVQKSDDEVTIVVKDSGIGISQEFLPLIFERFRQADSSSTRRFGGVGLGLSIAKHIVELHGGRISGHSAGEGAGATFEIHLPMNKDLVSAFVPQGERVATDSVEEQTYSKKLTGRRVLLIDDDVSTLTLMKRIFKESEAHVRLSSSAKEGLAIMEEWSPDLLISDIAMPDHDGFWFMQQLQALQPVRNVRTIALTAYASVADQTRVLAAGFHRCISKPVVPSALLETVENLLSDALTDVPGVSNTISILSGKKVLLVEDDLLSTEMLRAGMERQGLIMRSAANASEALSILSEWHPDIIISDLGLPDEDGYSLIKKIRALPAFENKQIPAIALTGYGKEEGARAIASGFHIYKSKPVDLQSLVSVLTELVR